MNRPLPKYIMYSVNALLLLFLVPETYCQSIQLKIGQTSLVLNTAATLEKAQVSLNAISISVLSSNSFSVYAKVSSVSSSSGIAMPASMLALKLNTVSPSRTANYNTITLSTNNQLVIQSYSTGGSYITYAFNLVTGPVGYSYPPGSQLFNVLLTLTYP